MITMTSTLDRQRSTSTTRWTARWGALATAALVAGGCGSSKGAKPDGGPDGGGGDGATAACVTVPNASGMLKVVIAGLPDGATPMIQVQGGSLHSPMVLTPGTAVTLDATGGYEIFYRRYKAAPAANSAVGNAYYISESTFTGCIKDGETTTATLTYTKEPGSGKVFMSVANPMTLGNVIAGFDGTDLVASGAKTPSVWKSKNFTGRAAGGAVDSFGNLWMPGGDRVNGYAMSSLAMTSDAPPEITLAQPANVDATFAAFDSVGNLWISRSGGGTSAVVRYNGEHLDDATVAPDVTITSPDLDTPAGLAFDDLGNLWVASRANDKVLAFKAAHLAASSTGAADIVITTKTAHTGVPVVDAPYTEPVGLAFDKDKNLWVGYIDDLVKLTVAQQGASGDLGGVFAVKLATGDGFAFDEGGGVWTSGPGVGSPAGQHQFQHVPAAKLATAGDTPAPDVTVDSAELGSVDTIVINPAPTWSLLHDWL